MIKVPVMKKLMSVMASILIIFIFAVFQAAVAAGSAAAPGGAVVLRNQPLKSVGIKKTASPKTKKQVLNLTQPLAGSTLITYTYDSNGNLIGKTKVSVP